MNKSIDDILSVNTESEIPKRKDKLIEWTKRYGIAEIVSIAATYVCSYIADALFENNMAVAYGATFGATAGFYGTMILKDIRNDYLTARKDSQKYGVSGVLKTSKNLLIEFGAAEILDIAITRPAATVASIYLLGKGAGIIIGKVIADIAFYIPVIISYELRKKSS
ncbi:TPA: hypothetical protein HA246_01825 [Candidatus Woesearchaeota archaeon]|nr:hypothetical protein [Candidatus Woesearchaeota archaeon]